ncbi:hypothetical protein SITYG_16430 [Streptococcus intermedius]|uniref:Uncharacterized protein n=1 Tax=Streptococcus intermedius TaxID=1338 RepID=A0AAD1CAB2_STRIT|nr:hypothetical protein SITYG_16430 [Streptococcus intermedius]
MLLEILKNDSGKFQGISCFLAKKDTQDSSLECLETLI